MSWRERHKRLVRTNECLLLGTGPRPEPPDAGVRKALAERGVGVEAMDSRAAARSWRLLRDEGRWVSAV